MRQLSHLIQPMKHVDDTLVVAGHQELGVGQPSRATDAKGAPQPGVGHVVLPASGAAHRPPQQLTVRALVVEALAEGDPGGPLAFDLGADEVADARVVDELRRRRSQLDDCVRVGIAC